MKTILVPVDFSDCSKLAVAYADALAARMGGEIYLLHVVEGGDVDTGAGGSGSWAMSGDVMTVPFMIARLKMVKKEMAEFIQHNSIKSPVSDIAEVGEPYVRINEAARKHEADIIVMGTHGISGMKEKFIGSVAEKVAQNAECPVLSIKEEGNPNPGKIIFASDFTDEAHHIFGKVLEFARLYNAELCLLNVVDSRNENAINESRLRVSAFARQHDSDQLQQQSVAAESTEEGILRHARDIGAGMIAIGTHGRKGLARFFGGTVSGELVNHAYCPVLTINFKLRSDS